MGLVARWAREEVWKFDKNYLEMELKGCKLVCLKFCYIVVKIENLKNLNWWCDFCVNWWYVS